MVLSFYPVLQEIRRRLEHLLQTLELTRWAGKLGSVIRRGVF